MSNEASETDCTAGEEWRPIPGYDPDYQVSSLGRVRSRKRRGARGWQLAPCPRCGFVRGDNSLRGWKLLAGSFNTNGYTQVGILRIGAHRATEVMVHKLVLLAFVGPCPDGMESMHANNIRSDCRLENLSYGTKKQNMANMPSGNKRHWSSMTRDQVAEARRMAATGLSGIEIASRLGVRYQACTMSISGRTWKDVLDPPPVRIVRRAPVAAAKLNVDTVAEMRRRYCGGETCVQLAKAFSVGTCCAASAVFGRTWKACSEPPCEHHEHDWGKKSLMSNEIVTKMRIATKQGSTVAEVAREFGVDYANALNAIRGKTYTACGEPPIPRGRGAGKILSDEEKKRIHTLRDNGWSIWRIARDLGRSYGAVYSAVHAVRSRLYPRSTPSEDVSRVGS